MRGFQKALWLHARRPGRVLKKLRLHSLGIPQGLGWGGERRFLWWFLKFLEGKQGGGEGDGKNFGRQDGAGDAKLIFWRCHSKIKY